MVGNKLNYIDGLRDEIDKWHSGWADGCLYSKRRYEEHVPEYRTDALTAAMRIMSGTANTISFEGNTFHE